jgi:hypothetical protein
LRGKRRLALDEVLNRTEEFLAGDQNAMQLSGNIGLSA